MRKNRLNIAIFSLFSLVLFNSACAQNPPTGLDYVKEETLVQNSTVLLNNGEFTIPLQDLSAAKIASVHFTNPNAAGFDSLLNKYAKVDPINGNLYNGVKNINDLSADLKWYNTIILQLTAADVSNPQIINFITQNQKIKIVIIALFGSGNSFSKLNDVTAPIIWSQRTTPVAEYFSAQAIFGGVAITQKLTNTFSPRYAANMGFITAKTRLQYTVPEDAGVNSINLIQIDDIAREAISAHATPGCVVLVAKDGKVIFNKAYGDHTYDPNVPDKLTDIFDLASLTKVTAMTIEVMKLYDEGKISLDATIGDYIPGVRGSNKSDITVRELLEHQAGLVADIPTYEKLHPSDHSTDSSAAYPTKVTGNYFLRKDYFKDVMWQDILKSPLRTRGQYVYSDVSMVLMKEICETITSIPLNEFVLHNFYKPLGMKTAGFLPLYRFPASQIIPTEQDAVFRHTLLVGYTEDQTAALMGNVSGNAGLFASANDVAILYQMILNRGTYGGAQYIKPETIDLFTAKQSAVSRRGLGFDRWDPLEDHHYPSKLASPQTYGHTGYTGTCVWVDPKYNLVYVFLSNRVNPTVGSKLSSLNIRPRIQDAIYQAIQKGM
ncbi:serine hydrolase domain-containing protein [Mucilaginibacter sp.]